mgnify:CR=1 FL=1
MIHVIPRQEEDGVGFSLPKRKMSDQELHKIQPLIGKKMAQLTGKKVEPKAEALVDDKTDEPIGSPTSGPKPALPTEGIPDNVMDLLSKKEPPVVDAEFGEVETREFCSMGFCPCCGEPNWKPRRFRRVYFCSDCIKGRLEDCVVVAKAIDLYLNPPEEDTTE